MAEFSSKSCRSFAFVAGAISVATIIETALSGCIGLVETQAQEKQSPQKVAVTSRPKLGFDKREIYGRYYFGDGLGVNCSLSLRPNGRFDFAWHGCMGEYDRNFGQWSLNGDVLTLRPQKPYEQKGFQGMNIRFIPVKWGSRYLLIDENEMPGFCASAANEKLSTEKYVRSFDYVKATDDKPVVKGKPVIPIRFQEFYEKGPVEAKITWVNRDGHVILNKGSADRLKPGMLMEIVGFDRINLKVVSVKEGESIAKPFYFWNSDRRAKVGDSFTSGTGMSRPSGTGFRRLALPPEEPKAQLSKSNK